jgi:hypothetical protein
MSDEPKRVLIGVFPAGVGSVHSFGEDVGGRLLAEAAAKLTAERDARETEKAEAETRAKAFIRVDKAWLLSVLRDLIARIERDETVAGRRGDDNRRRMAARKAIELREDFDAVFEHREPPP